MIGEIGFIGIGNMGTQYVNRLLDRKYHLILYDINNDALKGFSDHPLVTIVSNPKEVADAVDTVMISLPNPNAVKEVVMGKLGIKLGSKIRYYIDLSTTGSKTAKEIAEKLDEQGIITLDAPVSGGVQGAKDGSLSVMVSGDKEAYLAKKQVLEIIGEKIFYVGSKTGQAQIMKLANNFLSAAALAASSEALIFGVMAGLDPKIMLDVINVSSGRNSATLEKIPNNILNRKFNYGFKTGLTYKDIALCIDEADNLGVTMWIGNNVKELWKVTEGVLGSETDMTEIIRLLEKWNSIQVSSF